MCRKETGLAEVAEVEEAVVAVGVVEEMAGLGQWARPHRRKQIGRRQVLSPKRKNC